MYAASSVIFVSLVITCVRSYPGHWNSPTLNPVHGLYVKPSSDGTKGDLYVAATEENGVKSTWTVDQPVNFLPVAAATQPHAAAVALTYPGFTKPIDEGSTQKRSVIASPTASPPVQYAYALPVPSSEGTPVASYPYIYPYPVSTPESSATKCDSSSTTPQYPFQLPFQLFYPQMMTSAYSNAMSILKDAGLSEDTASSVMAHHLSPSSMWPPSSYGYPMYVMVDPSAWLQSQTTTTPATSTSTPNKQEEETTKNP